MKSALLSLFLFLVLPLRAQKWRYDFIVPDNGNFVAAIQTANRRADKSKRFRIFIRSSNYRIKGEGNLIETTEGGKTVSFPSPMTVLTAPNTSIIGEQMQNTQVENCPQHEGLDITSTLFLNGADSTYMQDLELWSNFRNDASLFANRSVALNEKRCRGNVLKNVSLMGTQATYYTNDGGTTYLEDCRLAGTVDIVCGGGTVFFNHCDLRLVKRGSADHTDILCAPATAGGSAYGYVFNDCYIDGPDHQRGKYRLGRPWKNAPRAAFINCCMNIEPAAEGWADGRGTLPARFAEFESTNGYFELLDLSRRKTSFLNAAGQPQQVAYSPSLTPEEAGGYTLGRVFPGWQPQDKTEQVVPPTLRRQGRVIMWDDIPEAGCYAVLCNRKIVAFTTTPSFTVPAGTPEGAFFTVRCANQMGGLGLPSERIVFSTRVR